jgi:hypothetical protein
VKQKVVLNDKKKKKLRTQRNGKFNDIVLVNGADENNNKILL